MATSVEQITPERGFAELDQIIDRLSEPDCSFTEQREFFRRAYGLVGVLRTFLTEFQPTSRQVAKEPRRRQGPASPYLLRADYANESFGSDCP